MRKYKERDTDVQKKSGPSQVWNQDLLIASHLKPSVNLVTIAPQYIALYGSSSEELVLRFDLEEVLTAYA